MNAATAAALNPPASNVLTIFMPPSGERIQQFAESPRETGYAVAIVVIARLCPCRGHVRLRRPASDICEGTMFIRVVAFATIVCLLSALVEAQDPGVAVQPRVRIT